MNCTVNKVSQLRFDSWERKSLMLRAQVWAPAINLLADFAKFNRAASPYKIVGRVLNLLPSSSHLKSDSNEQTLQPPNIQNTTLPSAIAERPGLSSPTCQSS
jgi:hypothetical protein